MIRTDQ